MIALSIFLFSFPCRKQYYFVLNMCYAQYLIISKRWHIRFPKFSAEFMSNKPPIFNQPSALLVVIRYSFHNIFAAGEQRRKRARFIEVAYNMT